MGLRRRGAASRRWRTDSVIEARRGQRDCADQKPGDWALFRDRCGFTRTEPPGRRDSGVTDGSKGRERAHARYRQTDQGDAGSHGGSAGDRPPAVPPRTRIDNSPARVGDGFERRLRRPRAWPCVEAVSEVAVRVSASWMPRASIDYEADAVDRAVALVVVLGQVVEGLGAPRPGSSSGSARAARGRGAGPSPPRPRCRGCAW